MRRSGLVVAAVVGILGGTTSAHHSIVGVYDPNQRRTLEGVVSEFRFVNPHPVILIVVRDASARTEEWRLELDNRRELAEVGFTPDTIKPDDRVVVTGSLARDGAPSLYVRRLDRPSDGFWYEQTGMSPRTGRRPN